jgi:hypothetical protein
MSGIIEIDLEHGCSVELPHEKQLILRRARDTQRIHFNAQAILKLKIIWPCIRQILNQTGQEFSALLWSEFNVEECSETKITISVCADGIVCFEEAKRDVLGDNIKDAIVIFLSRRQFLQLEQVLKKAVGDYSFSFDSSEEDINVLE